MQAGLVKIRVFRPFPAEELAQALQNVKALAILDKAESFSAQRRPPVLRRSGRPSTTWSPVPVPWAMSTAWAGRDITPAHFTSVFARLEAIAAGGELGPVYSHLGQRG